MNARRISLWALAMMGLLSFRAPAQIPPTPDPVLRLALGPYVQYTSPSEALVSWWTQEESPSMLDYGLAGPGAKYSPSIELQGGHQGKLENHLKNRRAKKRHVMRIQGLRWNDIYAYRITARQGDSTRSTPVYELDTALNYSRQPLPADVSIGSDKDPIQRMAALAQEVLSCVNTTQGYCLVWGVADGVLMHELAAGSDLTVIGLDTDARRVADVRNDLYRAGVYGPRITIQHASDMAHLPYPDNFANLIVSERALAEGRYPGRAAEMHRILRPRGSAAVLFGPAGQQEVAMASEQWLRADSIDFYRRETSSGTFYVVTKPVPAGAGSWTHQYGDAGNTADSHDDLGGVTGTDQLRVQWLGRPGADFGMDRNPRMPAPLAANGRLFHQGMNRMIALDAYNGTVLWSMEIPGLQRVNMPRDAGNWCTDDKRLYAAIQDKCWAIDHNDGTLERAFELPKGFSQRDYEWGYVARAENVLLGSAVRKNAIYTDFWGGDAWYDKTTGAGTGKVCSDAIFAYNLDTGRPIWTWRTGLAINTTIATTKGRVYFVESRNEKSKAGSTRRLNDASFWSDQHLACLNARSGACVWETPLDAVDGIVTFFLCCRDDSLIVVSSANGSYHLYRFNPDDGSLLWHAEHKWPSDNHGGHMQHPVVLADRIFLEPCGYDLETGRRITSQMSGREGCATYCGTKYALVHRGQSRCITMWDFTTGRITSWPNLRPSCWLSTVVGDGMILSPEGGGGCSCGNWLEVSMAFSPKPGSAPALATPVTKLDNAAGRRR